MGQKSKNVEAVTDFADNRHFVRLHRDILLPAAACEAVPPAAGRWDDAKHITLEHAPADAHDEIRLFFDSAAESLSTDNGDITVGIRCRGRLLTGRLAGSASGAERRPTAKGRRWPPGRAFDTSL